MGEGIAPEGSGTHADREEPAVGSDVAAGPAGPTGPVGPVGPVEVAVSPATGSSRGRTRVVALTGAVAVVAAAGGFLVGRASAPDPGARVTSAPALEEPSAVTEAPAGSDEFATAATEAPASLDAETGVTIAGASGDAIESAGPGGGMGSWMPNAYPEPAQELVLERTLDDGSVVRAHGQWYEGDPYAGWPAMGDWKPEPWCQPTGSLRVAIAATDSINVSWAPWYREAKDGLAVSTFATGYVEDAPRFGVVAQVPADATSVTLTTPTGSDTATPTLTESGPMVVLLVPGPITDDVRLDLTRADGAQSVTPADLVETWSSPEYREACQPPPPALPEPGEQPADPAAAQSAVEAAFTATWGDDVPARLAVIDDGTGLEAAWEAVAAGPYAEAATGATFTIRELVFSAPDEAWFRYDIDSSAADFTDRYGRAVLGGDGVWRITRDTVCQDLSLAGGVCEPSWTQVLPPSAEGDPRYGGMPFEGVPATEAPVETVAASD